MTRDDCGGDCGNCARCKDREEQEREREFEEREAEARARQEAEDEAARELDSRERKKEDAP